jgi:hypothetical protein
MAVTNWELFLSISLLMALSFKEVYKIKAPIKVREESGRPD